MIDLVIDTLQRPNFLAFVALFLCGLYIAITHHNLVKKVIGLYIIQTSVLFILVTFSATQGATVPIVVDGRIDAGAYVNPLPHALTLTGIVVGVATLGVALAVVVAIYRRYGSLDEDEVLARLERE
jgi:multicomponent Na+:H+ antiporter subunit C